MVIRKLLLVILAQAGRRLRPTPLARSRLLNRIHGALTMRLYHRNEVDVGPFRVKLDPRDRVIAKKLVLYGSFERQEIKLLCALVKPGDQVLDVGANIGYHSMHLSRAVGPTGRVIAVEPDPDNLAILEANLRNNHCENVTVVPCAFGVEQAHIDLFQTDDNRGKLSFADISKTGRSVKVLVRRGDQVLAELGASPSIAKIDVEGAEPLVMSGLGSYKPDSILFEFSPPYIRAQGQDPEALLGSLVAEGYSLDLVDGDSGSLTRCSLRQMITSIERLERQQSQRVSNILARR